MPTGEIKLLEVNPNPGWCWDGKLNLMAEMAGLRYPDLLRLIIEAAQQRVAAQHPGRVIPLAAPRDRPAGVKRRSRGGFLHRMDPRNEAQFQPSFAMQRAITCRKNTSRPPYTPR